MKQAQELKETIEPTSILRSRPASSEIAVS
jgi:hypothetical protein